MPLARRIPARCGARALDERLGYEALVASQPRRSGEPARQAIDLCAAVGDLPRQRPAQGALADHPAWRVRFEGLTRELDRALAGACTTPDG